VFETERTPDHVSNEGLVYLPSVPDVDANRIRRGVADPHILEELSVQRANATVSLINALKFGRNGGPREVSVRQVVSSNHATPTKVADVAPPARQCVNESAGSIDTQTRDEACNERKEVRELRMFDTCWLSFPVPDDDGRGPVIFAADHEGSSGRGLEETGLLANKPESVWNGDVPRFVRYAKGLPQVCRRSTVNAFDELEQFGKTVSQPRGLYFWNAY
jgi:hypothetical protein